MALFAVIWVLSPFVLIPMLIIYIRASKNQEKICFEKDREISRYMEQIKKLKKNNEITEDDQKDAEDEIQKMTDKAIKEVDTIYAKKEKEIMEV